MTEQNKPKLVALWVTKETQNRVRSLKAHGRETDEDIVSKMASLYETRGSPRSD